MNKTPVWLKLWLEALTAGKGIDPDALRDRVIELLLRAENNLIQVNDDNEVYVDLQLPSGIKPTDDFPVWVTTGKILQADWRQQSGLILNWKTTSGDYNRLIYANDGKLYIDKGNGVWVELGGWGCNCNNIEHWVFDIDLDHSELMVAHTLGNTPSVWTIVVGKLDGNIVNNKYNKITFDGENEIDIIYTNGTNNHWDTFTWDDISWLGYAGLYFSWIIANDNNVKKFVVWNVWYEAWA